MNQALATAITQHELSEIRAFIEARSGIVFDDSRTRFFSGRVQEHMEHKSVRHGMELLRMIRNSNSEYDQLLERVLTQETSFFRYPGIFNALGNIVLPEIHVKKFWSNPRTLRIWSAGCSTGEEPYSIALSVCEALDFAEAWKVEILATDISRTALKAAENGRFSRRDLASLDMHQIDSYFTRIGAEYSVRPKLRSMISFAPMNLAQMIYMGRFDCIFCMNVLIYFSQELRAALIQRFSEYLEPGGYLFLGHAESVAKAGVGLEPIVTGDSLIYRKAPGPRAVATYAGKPV